MRPRTRRGCGGRRPGRCEHSRWICQGAIRACQESDVRSRGHAAQHRRATLIASRRSKPAAAEWFRDASLLVHGKRDGQDAECEARNTEVALTMPRPGRVHGDDDFGCRLRPSSSLRGMVRGRQRTLVADIRPEYRCAWPARVGAVHPIEGCVGVQLAVTTGGPMPLGVSRCLCLVARCRLLRARA